MTVFVVFARTKDAHASSFLCVRRTLANAMIAGAGVKPALILEVLTKAGDELVQVVNRWELS